MKGENSSTPVQMNSKRMNLPSFLRSTAFFLSLGLLLGCIQLSSVAQDTTRHHEKETSEHYEHSFENAERWADEFNDPERDKWQKPEAVVEAVGIDDGMTVADVGAGTGYFVPFLSEAVGENGQVLAVDIELSMLEYVAKLAKKNDLPNVDTVLAEPTDSHLPSSQVDRILIVNTWHHIPDRGAYSRHLAGRLTSGGSVWVVDFTRDAPMGPPKKHRLSPSTIVDELEQGGLQAEVVDVGLPNQFVVVGRRD